MSSSLSEIRFKELLQRLRSLHLMRPPSDFELTPSQVGLLVTVAQSPGSGVLELAESLNVKAPTVSVGVRRLVKSGCLQQRRDPEDRRAKPIFLTEKSETLLKQLRRHRTEILKSFLSGLTEDEQEELLLLLDKAISAMENQSQEDA
ncbi:MAG: MarR family transcriptional regulator [Chloroflexota bacterium]|nr:MarR family transcriptional regulator [Chloroflexota bacterium]